MAGLSCGAVHAATAAGRASAASTAAAQSSCEEPSGSDESRPANSNPVRQLWGVAPGSRPAPLGFVHPRSHRPGALARGWRRAPLGVPIILKSICEERKTSAIWIRPVLPATPRLTVISLKLGIVGCSCSNACAMTLAETSFESAWEKNMEIARMLEAGGFECMVPIARCRDIGAPAIFNGNCMETHA